MSIEKEEVSINRYAAVAVALKASQERALIDFIQSTMPGESTKELVVYLTVPSDQVRETMPTYTFVKNARFFGGHLRTAVSCLAVSPDAVLMEYRADSWGNVSLVTYTESAAQALLERDATPDCS